MIFTDKERTVIMFLAGTAIIGLFTGVIKKTYFKEPLIEMVTPKELTVPNPDTEIDSENPATFSTVIVNINIANKDELTRLPGVGPVTAERILRYREDFGQFQSISDLQKVKGIGPKTFEKLKTHIAIN